MSRLGCRIRFLRGAWWWYYRLLILVVLLLQLPFQAHAQQTNVEWKPNNEQDGAGPLPLSQNQRNQLLELEQAIMNSPDPQGTLQQVAQSNNMQPQELADLLVRNRNDLSGAAGGRGGGAVVKNWPRTMLKLLASIGALIVQYAKRHPRNFAMVVTTLVLMVYILITAPRTGLVLSSSRGIMSHGYTTMWNPPTKYVNRLLHNPNLVKKPLSKPLRLGDLDLHVEPTSDKDGIEWIKTNRKSDKSQAVTAQVTIDLDTIIGDDDEEINENEVTDMVLDTGASVLSHCRLTEFATPSSSSMRIQTSGKHAYLVMKKLGNWGRYGLVPLKIRHTFENSQQSSRLTLSTLAKSHFDGQISISISRLASSVIKIQSTCVIPKRGIKLKKKLAAKLVQTLADSVCKSTITQSKQTLARQATSQRYRSAAKDRATARRKNKHEQEVKQEEMARDRKRKWQRQHRDVGRYRPSGTRMQSPNNC